MKKLFTTILPSLLAGGLLFGTTLTGAQPAPPAPPSAKAPKPPKPPKPPKATIKIDLDDIDDLVDEQIEHALDAIGDNDQIPAHVREAVKSRLEKVRIKVKKRIAKVGTTDLEGLKVELDAMGDELGQEMERFGKDMEKWGKDFEKQMKKKIVIKGGDPWKGAAIDPPDNIDFPDSIDVDDLDDMKDVADAMASLRGQIKLDPRQKEELRRLHAESDAKVQRSKDQLEAASEALRSQLESGSTNEDQIAKSIDNITRLEAEIRKARIISWVRVRKILDESQREKLEAKVRSK
jgi:hypothetical protein